MSNPARTLPAPTVRRGGELGPILRDLRRARGWSQTTFGKKMGLSQERISAIERCPESVSLDQLLTLLMYLDAELVVRQRDHTSSTPW